MITEETLHSLLDQHDSLLVECDGLTKVLHTLLSQESLDHTVHQGQVTYMPTGTTIPLHRWIEISTPQGPRTIDYRARMWLGEAPDIPHGIFATDAYPHLLYQGQQIPLPIATPIELRVLLAQVCGTLTLLSYKHESATEHLHALMKNQKTWLIEGRYSPSAPGHPEWYARGPSGLAAQWHERYLLLSDSQDELGRPLNWLGNKNYKHRGRGIALVHEQKGLQHLQLRLWGGHHVILLCGCPIYRNCHLHTIVAGLLPRLPGLPVHILFPHLQKETPAATTQLSLF